MARKFENPLKFITWWGCEARISPRVLRCAQCSKWIWLVETVFKSLRKNHARRVIFFYGQWQIWLKEGWEKIGRFFHVFDLCSKSCRSFWISSCPVPVWSLRIQILNTRGSTTFSGKSLNVFQVWAMAWKFEKNIEILHVVMVWDHNFAWGLALRAMFKINIACRDGFVSNGSVLKQYCSTGGGQSGWKKGGFFLGDFFTFLMCTRMFVNRFQFPFVQPQFWSWGFRFWTREVPENSESKVWMSSRFGPWRENSKIS